MTWRASDSDGVVAVWFALLVVVLFGMAAIAVDFSRWYVESERLQKTADAAALAGAASLPGDPPTADRIGRDIARANLPALNGGSATYSSQLGRRPTQLKVTITRRFDNFFAGLLGLTETTVTRDATAEYAGPLPMGSPCNVLGHKLPGEVDRFNRNCVGMANLWAVISGPSVNKARGDAYGAAWCLKPDDGLGIDGCDRTGTLASPGRNLEYDADGYAYIVRVSAPGELRLEGYDIGFVPQGHRCDLSPGLTSKPHPTNRYVTSQKDANVRYATGTSAYCAGDVGSRSDGSGTNEPVRTVVTVRAPSPTPWAPFAGDPVCVLDLPGWNSSTPRSALAWGGDDLLQRTYHRWADLCGHGISVQPGEDWVIQVQAPRGGAQNVYGLRALMSGQDDNVQLFPAERFSVLTSVPGGTSTSKFLRLDSGAAGHTLTIKGFDIGDAVLPVTATVLQPDSDVPYPRCFGSGPVSGPLPNCSITTTRFRNGGRWQTISIPIPTDYKCRDDRDHGSCWLRLRFDTAGDQDDTTTWTASLDGQPVRIIE
ncbi:MAG: TadE/TadG family type IV pilus assembly protein [Candidatus Nanopelagicales bacterium]|nr:pilus assembly protein [Candidatus Nanopelagicales bacterium]MDZ4249074.1 TadE/TadG family type IV pilus assembly protein [Candidatus Nanopelagicales bacterium]